MTAYIIRRLIQMVFVTLLVAVATYFLFSIAPGGPLTGLRQSQQRLDEQDIARIRAQYELDLYWPIRFSRWLIGIPNGPLVIGGQEFFTDVPVGCYLEDGTTGICKDYVYMAEIPQIHPAVRSSRGILRGDFGKSTTVRIGQPVFAEIMSRLPATLELGIGSLLLSLLIGVPIGIIGAVRQYSRFDYFVTSLAFFGSAMPVFFFGILLILLFSVTPSFLADTYPWIPRLPSGSREAVRDYAVATWLPTVDAGSFTDRALHFLMPLFVLTFFNTAQWSRFVRASMLRRILRRPSS